MPVVAAASGLIFAGSTPPTNLSIGILLGLIGFAFALFRAPTPRRGAACGFAFAFAANLFALRFVPEVIERFTSLHVLVGWLALVLLAAGQSIAWAIGAALAQWLAARLTARFFAFAIGVYVAISLPAIFPWTPAGGLGTLPILLQTAELVGERGTSFLLACACGLFASGLTEVTRGPREAARGLVSGGALLLLLLGYGALRMSEIDRLRAAAPHARIALLQPDFDASFRWDPARADMMLERLSTLTKRAEDEGADLTVWPESAYPYTLPYGIARSPRDHRAILQQGVRGPVLSGVYLSKGKGAGTNSAFLVAPDGDIGPSYDKRHLLWFGETVPLSDAFPVLRRIFARGTGLDAGTDSVVLRTGPIAAAVLNCYEDTLPQAGREAMTHAPNVLVNITNDAWFAGSAEGELHLRLSVLRAIEARRDLLRAVNRGPTAWVDANGRILDRRNATEGLGPSPPLVTNAALLDSPVTLYTRSGELPLRLLALVALGACWRARLGRRPERRGSTKA